MNTVRAGRVFGGAADEDGARATRTLGRSRCPYTGAAHDGDAPGRSRCPYTGARMMDTRRGASAAGTPEARRCAAVALFVGAGEPPQPAGCAGRSS